ncbi:MAG: HAD family hydrolase [Humibacillus sp.]|nr:HAD family hydrolase [Humibacillus sp.]MDN5779705.1 HAD family hydrolase [Humibacillus sp.]
MTSHEPIDTVVFDVDGTLVDSNYQHALAWFRAFRRYDLTVQIWQIHRALGMGGDLLVAHVAGDEVEERHGDALRAAWGEEFEPMLPEVAPLAGVTDLLRSVKRRGLRLVLASSGKAEHVDAFLDLTDARSVADGWTTSDDAEKSKPDPELIQTALDRVGGRRGLVVGDATWDSRAAGRAELPAVAILSGGFSESELRDAGAIEVFHSLDDVRADLERGAFDAV